MFDAVKETKKIITFIRDYFDKNKLGGVVIGISGGKDSAVVAGLFTQALGKDRVVGVTMPCHSLETDRIDAKKVADYYGFKLLNFDITNVFDSMKKEVNKLGDFTEDEVREADINTKSRLRMTTLYYLAALLRDVKGKTYLVAGTSNKCEQFVGYFTKGGDSVSDIKVLSDLTVEEVIKVGEVINVPREVLYKTPSDGLSGLSDEEKMGITYNDIAKYMENPNNVDSKIREKIYTKHIGCQHKFNIPTYKKEK